ncbi:alpha/beta hydrolase [Aquimarina aggregata]|uniref:alpha/beta hydrolase n=1 Tax=Aquimarina aggregata TaxID=1642818 RepID=UPI0024915EF6|nr:alpha/beta hydrolase [Aquimarina aggregata]
MRRFKKIVYWLVLLYIAALLGLYFYQEKVLFQPQELPQNYTYSFKNNFNEFFLTAKDEVALNGIHFKSISPKGVVLYFHGNAGNLKRWGEIVSLFVDKQYDVIIMDYRGYGKNKSTITEEKLYTDAQLFYNYAAEKYSENDIIVYGRSLGTGIAVKIASENHPRNLILETPYYNLKDVAKNWFPYFPVGLLLKYKIPSNRFIQNVRCPIAIYHGTNDKVVPYSSGKLLFESIPGSSKEMFTIANGSHNNLSAYNEYTMTIDRVLNNRIGKGH